MEKLTKKNEIILAVFGYIFVPKRYNAEMLNQAKNSIASAGKSRGDSFGGGGGICMFAMQRVSPLQLFAPGYKS